MSRVRSLGPRRQPGGAPAHALPAADWDPASYPAYIATKDNYAELHQAMVDATTDRQFRRVLDIGMGTGETSRYILEAHPEATLVGLDSSPRMLEAAAASLGFGNRVSFVVSHMEDPLPEGPFDLVVSALTIHHLRAPAKASLFSRIGRSLVPGGRFVLGDQVKDPSLMSRLQRSIREYGISVTARSIVHRRTGGRVGHSEPDRPDVLEDQMAWMAAAGLQPTLLWQRGLIAVVSAEKAPDVTG